MKLHYTVLFASLCSSSLSWAFHPPLENEANHDTRRAGDYYVTAVSPVGSISQKNGYGTGGTCYGTTSYLYAFSPQSCQTTSQGISNLSVNPSVTQPYSTFYVNFCMNRSLSYIGMEFLNYNRWDADRLQLFYFNAPSRTGCYSIPFSSDYSDTGNLTLNFYGAYTIYNYWGEPSFGWTNLRSTNFTITW